MAFTRWDPLRDLLALHEQFGQLVGSDAPGWTPPVDLYETSTEFVLTAELAGLTADAPRNVFDRIAARWVRVPGPVGDLYVAFTDHGIAYVRVDSVVEGEAGFAAEFRERFGRPLLAASRSAPSASSGVSARESKGASMGRRARVRWLFRQVLSKIVTSHGRGWRAMIRSRW